MMPAIQGRLPTTNDFEDISLYDSSDLPRRKRYEGSHSSQGSDSSTNSGSREDPHDSIQSVSSTLSTPTLASDTSSLRSSMSVSSPTLVQSHYGSSYSNIQIPPSQGAKAHAQPVQIMQRNSEPHFGQPLPGGRVITPPEQHTAKGYGRRRSVPALVDNTSMASLTMTTQGNTRTRKQREKEFEADMDDEIWPSDGFMFNVPMSPALYAQQKMKHYQMNSVSVNSNQPAAGPRKAGPHHKSPEGRSQSSAYSPSPLHQQVPGPPRRSAANYRRKSLPSIDEHKGRIRNETRANSGDETYPNWRHSDQPTRMASMTSLPALLSNRGSFALDANSSIDGLDPDASDLTLEFCRLEERQRRYSNNEDTSNMSIASLAMSDADGALPSPSIGSVRASEDSGSERDSRRSSLTRPENLPPKSPEEERKHMKEYEKLLREAAAAEKRKQQKREKEASQRAHQTKQDSAAWQHWLDRSRQTKLSSDLRWRGIPEKQRGAVWMLQKSGNESSKPNTNVQRKAIVVNRNDIVRDSELVWPECGIFGVDRPLHGSLLLVVETFMMSRTEIPYSFALTSIAALLLLYLDEQQSTELMVKLIEPESLVHAVLSGNERLASANYVSFGKVFRSTFERLSEHFDRVNITDSELLGPLIGSLFTAVLPTPEAAARILDVYVFEGDSFLLRVALGLLRINEAWLYASKDEILEQLMNPRSTSDDELMDCIRDVTRN